MRNKILVVNPNTNLAVTGWLAEEARRAAGPGFEIVAVNANSGLAALETPEHVERAARAVEASVAEHRDAEGAIVAAFGDPGLREARARALMPMAGLGEAGMKAAAADGGTFSVVTLGAAMRTPILDRSASLGLGGQLVDVLVLPFLIPEMVAHREARREAIVAAVRSCEGDTVLLGGAPFAGMAEGIARETGRRVIDGVAAAVAALVAAVK